jgi:hypothetical protein
MLLRMERPAFYLFLKVLFGIVAVPLVLGMMLFLLCGFAPPLIFLLAFFFFSLWGSHWVVVCVMGGLIVWCGAAQVVVLQKTKKEQSRRNEVIFPLYGMGWIFALIGVMFFLIFWRSDWFMTSAMFCEMGALGCWYLVERSEKKQQARMQFLAVLHEHTQAKLEGVEHLDESREREPTPCASFSKRVQGRCPWRGVPHRRGL